jgi:hypothetical protein
VTRPVHAYAWDWYNAAGNSGATIVPTRGNVSKTIRVYLDDNDPVAYAAQIGSAVTAAAGAGNPRNALRLWQEIWVADEAAPVTPRFLWYDDNDFSNPDNWWFQPGIAPYVVPQPSAANTAAWAAFGGAWRAQGITLHYLVGEEEQEIGFDGIRGITNRTNFFASITGDPESPYFGLTNIGSPSSHPLAAQFRVEYNSWGYFNKAELLRALHGPIVSDEPVPQGADIPWSNYRDVPEGAVANRFATPVYATTTGTHTIPAGLTSPQDIANWTRWANLTGDLNEVRRIAAVGTWGWINPWIGVPGYGADPNGAEVTNNAFGSWANAVRQPWEKVFWRAVMTHLMTMGIDEYIPWNASPDPNRADNCVFMDAWFFGKVVGDENARDNPQIAVGSDSITTTGNGATFTTGFADLFQMTTLYYTRAAEEQEVAYLSGWPWSQTNPLVVSPGAAGDAEVAAMKAAIEINQGTTITTQEVEDAYMPPTQIINMQVSSFAEASSRVKRGTTVHIGGRIRDLAGDGFSAVTGIKAQVRRRPGSTLVHDFNSPSAVALTVVEGELHFFAEVSTAAWTPGTYQCDVFITVGGKDYGVGEYVWEVEGSTTEVGA